MKVAGEDAEVLAAAVLAEYSLVAERFSKTEQQQSKTPDFKVRTAQGFAFFCEVKSAHDPVLGDLVSGGEGRPTVATWVGPDSTFNRIASDIYAASQQFDAVNPLMDAPNVLMCVNYDASSDFNDLVAVLTGRFLADDGSRDCIFGNVAGGRVAAPARRIHLYWWIDARDGQRWCFANQWHLIHVETLCRLFRLDSSTMRRM